MPTTEPALTPAQRVFLDLRVRVRRGWRQSSETVVQLGLTHSYRQTRLRTFPFGDSFFMATRGRALAPRRVEEVFRKLSADIVSRGDRLVVRLYDFRHTFATRLIARWSQQSRPPAHHLILLSRYLGHRGFNSTWWYVSSDSRSLRSAALRFGNFHQS